MKARTRVVVLSGVALSVILSIGLAAQAENAEQTLLQLERDWDQANAKNDAAALERILAPEFVSTDSDGRLMTRDQIFARRKSGQVKYITFASDEQRVHVNGDMAIVTGRSTIKAVRDGKDFSGQERWTDVWVRRNSRWLAVASHSSRIATP